MWGGGTHLVLVLIALHVEQEALLWASFLVLIVNWFIHQLFSQVLGCESSCPAWAPWVRARLAEALELNCFSMQLSMSLVTTDPSLPN